MEDLGDLESIVNQAEQSTNNEIPMEAPPQAEAPPAEVVPPTPQEYEFQASGRTIKAPLEKILRWASNGFDAPNRIGELSQKLSDYESKSKQYQEYEKTYKPVDEWAKQNPDKWQSLFQSWQQAQYGAQPQPGQEQAMRLPPEVLQEMQASREFREQLLQKETVQREQAADHGLDGQIQSIRKQFANFDLDAPGETGKSREFEVLEHATRNGIPSFRAAFLDKFGDQLLTYHESKGREAAANAVSDKTRAGLLGKNPAPNTGKARAIDLSGKNYDQIYQMILANELGQSG